MLNKENILFLIVFFETFIVTSCYKPFDYNHTCTLHEVNITITPENMTHIASLDLKFCQQVTLPLYQLRQLKRLHMENIEIIKFIHSEPESYEKELDTKMLIFSIKDIFYLNLLKFNKISLD